MQAVSATRPQKKRNLWKRMGRQKFLLFLMIPGLIYFLIFKYLPMYGIVMAFQNYNPFDGIQDSPWVGLYHFEQMANLPYFWKVVGNTLRISILRILTSFPAPIILALLLNELMHPGFKRVIQTITYLPHFLSWVVVSGLIFQLVSPSYGIYGLLCETFGWEKQVLIGNPTSFMVIVLVSNIWKEVGYGSIIYLAAIAGINSEMYESAVLDGAGRFQQCIYITLPSLLPTISMLLVLNLGGILDGGFDQIFNLYNPMVMPVADIIDTYVYRLGLVDLQYSFSTAVNISKSVIALILVLSTNWLIGKISNYTVF